MASVVLLVDDDLNFATLVRHAFLKAWPDAVLQTLDSGENAIQYLLGENHYANREEFPSPSLVLLDLNMPGIDGFRVLGWKREIPELNPLPIVVWSTSDLPADVQQAYSLGAAAYLVKPTALDEYIDLIKHLKSFSVLPPAIRASPWVWSALSNVERVPISP
jgi:CheY-like chemotaxis protein